MTRPKILAIVIIALVTTVTLAILRGGKEAPERESLRDVALQMRVDLGEPEFAQFEPILRRAVAMASSELEPTCRVRLRVALISPWRAPKHDESLDDVIEAVRVGTTLSSDTVVVAVLTDPAVRARTGLCGWSHYFDDACLVALSRDDTDRCVAVVLVHEILHLFGAWHSPDVGSVMNSVRLPEQIHIDVVTREVMGITRHLELGRGVDRLGHDTVRELTRIAVRERLAAGEFSVSTAWRHEAWSALDSLDYSRAIQCARVALTVSEGLHSQDAAFERECREIIDCATDEVGSDE